ncbi:MAG: DeoR/GlpR family DNA-binding transcription regulator [Nocardioides sp.]|uniref:DeoR/GlpR family DNA-binding transcription regulator n=1 Tax=Nocardioides sp. TaxID=35761 RepID=UPI0039E3F17C
MLARQRQSAILEHVRAHGGARVSDLTQLLGVSDMTVRRDLDALARQGLLDKVHGGATAIGVASSEEPRFDAKAMREDEEKEQIAREAAALVQPGSAVALSAGTTTWALSKHLVDIPGLTVVTNSLRVATSLHQAAGSRTLILIGGTPTPSDALVGPIADTVVRSLRFDVLFLGCHGMEESSGLSTPNLAEAQTNRELIRSAHSVVVTADHTKWGTTGLSSFADLDQIDVLVTDSGMPAAARQVLGERVGRLVIAGSAPS